MLCRLIGTSYGGFKLPVNWMSLLPEDPVIYLVGVGEDVSFDCAVSGALGCNVHLFDPTPRAIDHVVQVKRALKTRVKPANNPRCGGGDCTYWTRIMQSGAVSDHIHFYPYGIYTSNTVLKFYQPKNPEHVSHSVLPDERKHTSITVPVKTLETVMNELGHTRIDMLKLDIENAEPEVLQRMLDYDIRPAILCVDFDSLRTRNMRLKSAAQRAIVKLKASGYRLVDNSNNDMVFIYTR